MDIPPVPAKKMSLPVRIIVVVCGLVAMAGGIAQCKKGVSEIREASGGGEMKQVLAEIEAAVEAGNKSGLEAQPMFQKLLNDVDSLGLAKVRQQQKDVAQKVADLFGQSAEQFRLAAKKSTEAAAQEPREKFKPFFTYKAQAYEAYAQGRAINQEITRMVMDESIAKAADLIAKATAAGERRDAAQKTGDEAEARANAAAKAAKDSPK